MSSDNKKKVTTKKIDLGAVAQIKKPSNNGESKKVENTKDTDTKDNNSKESSSSDNN